MGRDDARPVRGLHGGTAPARAFAAFMKPATATRPVEQFDTQVTLPEWQLESDEANYFGTPDEGVQVDEDGNPIAPATAPATGATVDPEAAPATTPAEPAAPPVRTPQQQLDDLIDSVTRDTPAPAPPARTPPPGTPPARQPPGQQPPQPGPARPTQ
jgi:penicillin-binding protein 1A